MGIYDEALAKSLVAKNATESFLENSDQVETAMAIGTTGRDTVKARKAATSAKLQKSKAAKAEGATNSKLDTLAKSARDIEFRELVAEGNTLRQLKGLKPLNMAELLEKGLAAAKQQLRHENQIVTAMLKGRLRRGRS